MSNDFTISADTDKTNSGGLRTIQVAAIEDVASIVMPRHMVGPAVVTLVGGASWSDIEFIEESASLNVNKREKNNGETYQVRVQASVAKDRGDLHSKMKLMDGRRYIVKTTDWNGYTQILGNLNQPLRMNFSGGSGNRFSQRNDYALTFEGEQDHKPVPVP